MGRIKLLLSAFLLLGTASCAGQTKPPPALPVPPAVDSELFDGLGSHQFPVSNSSERGQVLFNQGMAFLYAFNHDEAIRSFQLAAKADPECAMPWWGIAIANGPHINNPVVPETRSQAALAALDQALARLSKASPLEKDLIAAATKRYSKVNGADRKKLDAAYAKVMKEVWAKYPTNADVGAMYAEALMDLRPWDLWKSNGKPQPGTDKVLATLEQVFSIQENHPLANHLYIHAVEASPFPEKGKAAAARLRNLQPGLGHMVHMPSHVDVRTGNWAEAITTNQRAMAADAKYHERRPLQGFYRVYILHNQHMLSFAAMMRGQSALAIQTIDRMIATVPENWAKENAATVDGFFAMPFEVRVRFGRWDEILALAAPPEFAPLARAIHFAARATAYLAKGDMSQSIREEELFAQAARKVSADAFFGNNSARDLLTLQRLLLRGEILLRQGQYKAGLAKLRKAVKQDDLLRYDEPPDWIIPARHVLGAALLSTKNFREAELVYRADLKRWPENGWSLYGLSEALRQLGKASEAEATMSAHKKAWVDADVSISSSCLCQQ